MSNRDDKQFWKEAMDDEMESLKKSGAWELVPRPTGKNIVDCKWVFRFKRDENGNIVRYKSRLVARLFAAERFLLQRDVCPGSADPLHEFTWL